MTAERAALGARSLYLHIPFCDTRCPYCDFAIHIGGDHLHQPYVKAVIRELGYLAGSGRPMGGLDTVYLGGGTPGLLPPPLLQQLLEAVEGCLGISHGAEITIEANPTGLTLERAKSWLSLGINRLSLGVQSLDDRALRWLGRNHDSATAEAAIDAARQGGIKNLSCDLIYAIPEQPTAAFEAGLRRLIGFSPQHVSCYELTVEPATPLARSVAEGRVPAPSEPDFLEQHRLARALLAEAGLRQYEVSNYAQPGLESRHNLSYWQGRHYLAAGCGAHGFVNDSASRRLGFPVGPEEVGVRYWNLRSASTYIKRVTTHGNGRRGHEGIDREQAELERLACGLRLQLGVELTLPWQLATAERLAERGLLTIDGGRVAATPSGVEVLDRITLELAASEPTSVSV
ncbi:MAG: radical SAM family heme chaperone HemW [Candidatus Dormiibacterota bacterium]